MKTAFLDRDGVINCKPPEGDYVKRSEEFKLLPMVADAIRLLNTAGIRIIIVTNQRGIARGIMTEADLNEIHSKMVAELAKAGAQIDAIYYCPHEDGQCNCRKPQIGLFLRAKEDFPDIDFSQSFVIGDSVVDMEAAFRLGSCKLLVGDKDQMTQITELARARGITIDGCGFSLFDVVVHYVLPNAL